MRIRFFSTVWLPLVLAVTGLSQTRDTASVYGTVVDSQAAFVPGADITLSSAETGLVRKAQTNEAGAFTIPMVPVGSYRLSAEKSGFQNYVATGLLLRANDNIRMDVVLKLGDTKTQITVSADAAQVETRSATLGQVVEATRVNDLPLNGRNAADLTLLSPGVAPALGSNDGNGSVGWILVPPGVKSLTVNGSRNTSVRFTLDGGEHMDPLVYSNLPFPFPEAVEEFSIQSSNMTPEMGASSGGAVNVVTKSGTNELHAGGFWFVRNTAMDATNFFSHQQDDLKRNQMGFTVGGPIIKNKLFAFGGYQKLTNRWTGGNSWSKPLTAAERKGDFSGYPDPLFDPASGAPFAQNQIPASRFSPAAVALLTVTPTPAANGFYYYSYPKVENGDQYIVRTDYRASEKHSFLVRYLRDTDAQPFTSSQDNIYLTGFHLNNDTTAATLAHNFIASPNIVIHTQFTVTHFKSVGGSDFKRNFRDFGVNIVPLDNDMVIDIPSGSGFSTPYRVNYSRAAYEYVHDWSMTKGAHTMTFGGNITWRQYNEDTSWHGSGNFSFDGHVTGQGEVSGYDRADFMLGQFSYFSQNNGEMENRRQLLRGFFFNDVWRLSQRLTLNVGLRYEPYRFMVDTKDRVQIFELSNYQKGIKSRKFLNAPAGLLYPGDTLPGGGTVPRTGGSPDYNNLSPHLGFAWAATADGKTSLRGGYALLYDAPPLMSQNNGNDVAPFSYSVSFNSGVLDKPFLGREYLNRFPVKQFLSDTPYADPLYTMVVDGKFILPEVHNWNLTLERELRSGTLLRLGYVGAKSSHLKSDYDYNAPIYNRKLSYAENRDSIDDRRPIQGYQNIVHMMHGLGSIHNSLQVSVDRRYSKGLTLSGSYTLGRTIDYSSYNSWGGDSHILGFNFNMNRGPADFNRAQRLVASGVWELPALSKSPYMVRSVIGGWRLSGILTIQSGLPFSVWSTGDPMAGAGTARADLVGSGSPILDTGRSKGEKVAAYFDVNRLANAAPGNWGTLGRNALVGPGYSNLDSSLVKEFKLPIQRESAKAELRCDVFNLFNKTHLGNPDTNQSSSTFGQILSTNGDPRILQLGFKIAF